MARECQLGTSTQIEFLLVDAGNLENLQNLENLSFFDFLIVFLTVFFVVDSFIED